MDNERFVVPNAPEMNPERKEIVNEIIDAMNNHKLTYMQAYNVLNDVYKELQHRSLYLHL